MATIILKPTENCNSNCVYCDVAAKKRAAKSMPLEKMSLENLELVFIKINEYLLIKNEENITLIWHGGEPAIPALMHRRQ